MVVVDVATHSQKDGVEDDGCSLKDGAESFVLFLRDAQLVLWSSVLTELDLDELNATMEMNVTLKHDSIQYLTVKIFVFTMSQRIHKAKWEISNIHTPLSSFKNNPGLN